ncbi:hypothetical protein LLE49_02670 [Alicyclobacillus tolerans]|uniref:hypothetical protein n=1 Tax=Alicyclobacillus tolerans TaxID=90970 RepID=UPI001F2B8287|nr:hypothetical protein [Alicyclobacillus tolerans]MCF8563642.1 hypothetical protein [Alicyclobacillus tolerans]
MQDYRNNAKDSPLIWCIECRTLVSSEQAQHIMHTVFRVEPEGVFPFGICQKHNG